MAVEQQEKLAALKKWTHYDGSDQHSFQDITDSVLYKMTWAAWDEEDGMKARERGSALKKAKRNLLNDISDADSSGIVDARSIQGLFTDDEHYPDPQGNMKAAELRSDGDGSDIVAVDSDDEPLVVVGKKRKMQMTVFSPHLSPSRSIESDDGGDSPSTPAERQESSSVRSKKEMAGSKAKIKRKETTLSTSDGGKKHDLRDIANRGGGGRVMYVFEKISASKLVKEDSDDDYDL
jgi:DNA repair and recombination protein RAD54B